MRKLLLLALVLLSLQPAFSQAGMLDTTYGNGGISATFPRQLNSYYRKMAVQPNGRVAVLGFVNDPVDPSVCCNAGLTRISANGSIDRMFSRGLVVADYKDLDYISYPGRSDIAVQPDGKVLVTGSAYTQRSQTETDLDVVVIRYNKNGTRDSTFGNQGKVTWGSNTNPYTDDFGMSIAVRADGRIVVGALSINRTVLLVFNQDGSLHSRSFALSSKADQPQPYVSAYADGGHVFSYAENNDSIAVYSTRFGKKHFKGHDVDYFYNRHTILNNGKIAFLISKNEKSYLVLLKVNGTPDSTFDGDGYLEVPGESAHSITSEPNRKLLIQVSRTPYNQGIMRFKTDGSVDAGFGNNGFVASESGALAVYGNRLLVLQGTNIAAYLLNTDTRYVKVDLYGNDDPYVNRQWNSWNNLRNRHFNNFYYSDSTISNISAVMSARNGVNDNGADYGGGMAPAGVLRHSSYAVGTRTIIFSGLVRDRRYSFEFYASRNVYIADSTVFTINGVSERIGTYRNVIQKAVFINVAPDAQGQIVLTISSTRMYNYLNGFVLTESFTSTSTQSLNSVTAVPHETGFENSRLQVSAFPNPTRQAFTLQLKGVSDMPVQVRIFDAAGRLVEIKQNVVTGSFSIGRGYKPGVYYVQAVQGAQRSQIKLMKQ